MTVKMKSRDMTRVLERNFDQMIRILTLISRLDVTLIVERNFDQMMRILTMISRLDLKQA